MKKLFTLLLITMLLLCACDNMFQFSGSWEKGNGNVHINLGNGRARTILPSQYDLSVLYYKLVFINADSEEIIVESINGGTYADLNLPAGVYNLSVYGYENQTTANADAGNAGIGALFTGQPAEKPFTVSSAGNVIVNVILQPNPNIIKQTADGLGTLRYEINIPEGANGTFTVEGREPVSLNAEENEGSIILASGDYNVVAVIYYNEKVKVVREIAQIYDNATSAAKYNFIEEDFINSASAAIFDVSIGEKVTRIDIEDSEIIVWVHPDIKNSLGNITPKISFTGVMIAPIGPQNFSGERKVAYTVYTESGASATYDIIVKADTVPFITAPDIWVEGGIRSANYSITKSTPIADSLTLYYAKGDFEDAASIKEAEGVVSVLIYNDSKLNGIAGNLEDNRLYSFVVEAVKEHYFTEYSNIKKVTPSSKTHLAKEDFDWSGISVSYNGNPQPVTIDATAINGANIEINSSDITVIYSGVAPTVYSASIEPPVNVGKYLISVSVEETASFAPVSQLPLDGIYEITKIPFDNAPVLESLTAGTSAGTINYSFRASIPAANYYILYYAEGSGFPNAQAVIDAAGTTGLMLTSSLTGTITGLNNSATYSVVVVTQNSNYLSESSNILTGATLNIFASAPILTNNHIYTTAASTSSASTTILRYSFEESAPAADAYTVYYVTGNTNRDAAWLLNPANTVNKVPVPAGELSGTISITANQGVSILIVAEKENYARSNSDRVFNTAFNNSPNFTSLTAQANEPNQLLYAYSNASVSSGTITYRMFYIEGEVNDINTIVANGTEVTPPSSAGSRLITGNYNTQYSVVIRATHSSRFTTYSVVRNATTGDNAWVILPNFTVLEPANPTTEPNQFRYQFTEASPSATYKIYYLEGDIDDADLILSEGTPAVIGPTENLGTAATPGTSSTSNNAAHANNRVFFAPKYNTQYSVIVAAEREGIAPGKSNILKAETGSNTFAMSELKITLPDPANEATLLRYEFAPSTPANKATYTVYYMAGETSDPNTIIANGTAVHPGTAIAGTAGSAASRNFIVPNFNTTYSIVVEAKRDGFVSGASNIVTITTGREIIHAKVNVEDVGLDTKLTLSFENEKGRQYTPTSNVTLTYKYKGLRIAGGKLTNNIIDETTETITLTNDTREYIITSSNLVAITDIVVSATVMEEFIESEPCNSKPIELRLYNVAYEKAREYGAIELFSHGKAYSSAGGLGPTIQARASTIVNYQNGNPVDIYISTFSLGHGGLSGAGAATQHRESYYNGSTLYTRSNGGATGNSSGGTGATAPVRPNVESWDSVNSVASGHINAWYSFVDVTRKNPFNYITNDINSAYIGLHEYKYPNPQDTSNNWTSGRATAPSGLIDSTAGSLAYNSNGTFEFTMSLNATQAGSKTNVEWSGDQNVTALGNSYITFIIDEDMKFVKYHAMDSYTVQLLSATTYTCATMYFVYHKDSININGYATYRPHQTRPDHVNFVETGVNPEFIIAPHGNTATGNMVVNDSRYVINLNWIENCTTKASIP